MKKVFLSLAVIAALTVVSCKDKNAEAPAEAPVEEVVAPEAPAADTIAVDSAATTPAATETPAAETPAK